MFTWTIRAMRNESCPMFILHALQPARPVRAYSTLYGRSSMVFSHAKYSGNVFLTDYSYQSVNKIVFKQIYVVSLNRPANQNKFYKMSFWRTTQIISQHNNWRFYRSEKRESYVSIMQFSHSGGSFYHYFKLI